MELALLSDTKFSSSEISTSLMDIFSEYEADLQGIKKIAQFVEGKDLLINYFTAGNTTASYMCREIFKEDGAVAALNADYWSRVIRMTKVLEYMPAQKRNEWNQMIHDKKTPDFARETVLATVTELLTSRGSFFADKVDGIFKNLSGKHVTNSPMAFKERMIMGCVLDRYMFTNHQKVEYIEDLRNVIAQLRGQDAPAHWLLSDSIRDISKNGKFGEWFEFDGGAFKIKLFKVGTAHLEIHPEIAQKLNRILATKYPQVIPADKRQKTKTVKSHPVLKNNLSFKTLVALADLNRRSHKNTSYLSTSEMSEVVKKEVLTVVHYLGGKHKKSVVEFKEWPHDEFMIILRMGVIPDIKSHQYYPTKTELAQRMVDMAEIEGELKILEPSAGQGGIADHLPKDMVTCVEIDPVNCEILENKGFNVKRGDFLQFNGNFDRIVMNPPFSDNRAIEHTRHAYDCLKSGGVLVACLPASLKNKEVIKGEAHEWSETLEDCFDGTSVRVVLLKIIKK